MAKDTQRWPPASYYPYRNQSFWPPGDEEVDSQVNYTIDGERRAYGTSSGSGVAQRVGNDLQMTDGGAGPYLSDPSPRDHSPCHPAVDSACTRFAYYSPQQPSGVPTESVPWDLPGQHEGRFDGSGLPGPCGYGIPRTGAPDSFRSLSQMFPEHGGDSPRSFASTGAEQGSDIESTAQEPREAISPSRDHGYHFDLHSDLNGPWSPSVNQGLPSAVDRAIDAATRVDRVFSVPSSAFSGREHKGKSQGRVSVDGAHRDARHSSGEGPKPHKTREERRRSG